MAVTKAAPSAPQSKLFLLFSLGLAAVITGLFGIGTEYVRERHESHIQQCQLAGQVVSDENLNPDLPLATRRQISARSGVRFNLCLKD